MGFFNGMLQATGALGLQAANHLGRASAARGLAYSSGAGAVLGAGWGATYGRDPGQSRMSGAFGGFVQGALTGAAAFGAGRYGHAAFQGGALQYSLSKSPYLNPMLSRFQRAEGIGIGAGQAAWARMSADASSTKKYFGAMLKSNKKI